MGIEINLCEITSQWAEHNFLHVHFQSSMSSTNDLAKEEAFQGPLNEESTALYLAEEQTRGRGRKGDVWVNSEKGKSFLSSWSFLTKSAALPTLSPLIGLAVYRACSTTWPFLLWNLKAPNDIYIGNKKVAGILIENIQQGHESRIIIGFGFNVYAHPEIVSHSTSLTENFPVDTPLLAQDWISFLDRLLFELTDAVSRCDDPLSPTDQHSLMSALNLHPLLKQKYISVRPNGSLASATEVISWTDL